MKLFIRIPTNESVHFSLVPWLAWAARTYPNADISTLNTAGYGIAWGRNRMRDDFLTSDCTHLWMIDADTIPPTNRHLTETARDHTVVCGPYNGFNADIGVTWNVYNFKSDDSGVPMYGIYGPAMWPSLDKPFKVDAAGLGCSIIERQTLLALHEEPFYHPINADGTYMGEDFNFCRDVGGVTIEPRCVCEHMRTVPLLVARNQLEHYLHHELEYRSKSNGKTITEEESV